MQRELEVLSEQYSQKCLENAHLAQALEAERQALRQCQRENQELNAHNQVSLTGAPLSRPHPMNSVTRVWAEVTAAANLGLCFSCHCVVWVQGSIPKAGTMFKHLPVKTIQCSHRILSDYFLKTCLLLRKLGHT